MVWVVQACCIIHNMSVEERREQYVGNGAGGLHEQWNDSSVGNEGSGITFSRNERREDVEYRLQL